MDFCFSRVRNGKKEYFIDPNSRYFGSPRGVGGRKGYKQEPGHGRPDSGPVERVRAEEEDKETDQGVNERVGGKDRNENEKRGRNGMMTPPMFNAGGGEAWGHRLDERGAIGRHRGIHERKETSFTGGTNS
jgi:hypothetical protein